MTKVKRIMSSVMLIIMLSTSFIVSFAGTKNISTYTTGDKVYTLIVLQDDNAKRVVKTISSDGTEMIGTFDKINSTITLENEVNKSNEMKSFRYNASNEIVIDLQSRKQSSGTISPRHVGDEVIISSSLLFWSLNYRAEYVNNWVTYSLSTNVDYVNTGAVDTQDPSTSAIRNKAKDFKYNLENADTFGGDFATYLAADMMNNGTLKSGSDIKNFVEGTGYSLAVSVAASDSGDYELPLLTALFAFTDVALSYSSYLVKGCVSYANIHNCNVIIDRLKDMI